MAVRGHSGELITLEDQNRGLWDPALLAGGFRHLARSAGGPCLTRYHLQAEIESCHAAAARSSDTDWARIVRTYDYPYHAACAELLLRLGRPVEAAASLGRALALDPVKPVGRLLTRRLAAAVHASSG